MVKVGRPQLWFPFQSSLYKDIEVNIRDGVVRRSKRTLETGVARDGHIFVRLTNAHGRKVEKKLNELIARAALGSAQPLICDVCGCKIWPTIGHKNADLADCSADNLFYDYQHFGAHRSACLKSMVETPPVPDHHLHIRVYK